MDQVEHFSKLKCIVFPGKNPAHHLEQYEQAYELWKNIWGEFWEQQAGKSVSISDTFCKQDYILTTFYGDQCAALMLVNLFDFRLKSSREDSYFQKVWLPSNHHLIENKSVLAASHYTVHPDFRRDRFFVSMKEWISSLTVQFFLDSNVDMMVGAMRKNKGVDKTVVGLGRTLVETYKQEEMNLDLDLVTFERERTHVHKNLEFLIRQHWSNRIEVQQQEWRVSDEQTTSNRIAA